MSSIKPNEGSGEIDGGEEAAGCFVVSRGDGAVLFEATKEVLDQVASLIKFLVIHPLFLTIFLRWNDDFFSRFAQRFEHAIFGVVAFVRQEHPGFKRRQKNIGAVQIARLSRR